MLCVGLKHSLCSDGTGNWRMLGCRAAGWIRIYSTCREQRRRVNRGRGNRGILAFLASPWLLWPPTQCNRTGAPQYFHQQPLTQNGRNIVGAITLIEQKYTMRKNNKKVPQLLLTWIVWSQTKVEISLGAIFDIFWWRRRWWCWHWWGAFPDSRWLEHPC